MGYFLDEQDYPDIPDVSALIAEAESFALREVPILGTLTPDDPPVPPQHLSYWEQVGTVLNRVVRQWAAQGYEGLKTKMIGSFSKSWWSKAGGMDATSLRRIGALVEGRTRRNVGPVFSAPPVHSLAYLFNTGAGADRVG